jgi:hypothetical protein
MAEEDQKPVTPPVETPVVDQQEEEERRRKAAAAAGTGAIVSGEEKPAEVFKQAENTGDLYGLAKTLVDNGINPEDITLFTGRDGKPSLMVSGDSLEKLKELQAKGEFTGFEPMDKKDAEKAKEAGETYADIEEKAKKSTQQNISVPEAQETAPAVEDDKTKKTTLNNPQVSAPPEADRTPENNVEPPAATQNFEVSQPRPVAEAPQGSEELEEKTNRFTNGLKAVGKAVANIATAPVTIPVAVVGYGVGKVMENMNWGFGGVAGAASWVAQNVVAPTANMMGFKETAENILEAGKATDENLAQRSKEMREVVQGYKDFITNPNLVGLVGSMIPERQESLEKASKEQAPHRALATGALVEKSEIGEQYGRVADNVSVNIHSKFDKQERSEGNLMMDLNSDVTPDVAKSMAKAMQKQLQDKDVDVADVRFDAENNRIVVNVKTLKNPDKDVRDAELTEGLAKAAEALGIASGDSVKTAAKNEMSRPADQRVNDASADLQTVSTEPERGFMERAVDFATSKQGMITMLTVGMAVGVAVATGGLGIAAVAGVATALTFAGVDKAIELKDGQGMFDQLKEGMQSKPETPEPAQNVEKATPAPTREMTTEQKNMAEARGAVENEAGNYLLGNSNKIDEKLVDQANNVLKNSGAISMGEATQTTVTTPTVPMSEQKREQTNSHTVAA